jgi:NAD(P)-dependent dehydrogenase (short-subunit alcohol dehydrogenase family)
VGRAALRSAAACGGSDGLGARVAEALADAGLDDALALPPYLDRDLRGGEWREGDFARESKSNRRRKDRKEQSMAEGKVRH